MQAVDRQQWEDPSSTWDRGNVSLGMVDTGRKDTSPAQGFIYDEFTVQSSAPKKKIGAPDPRFKRVVPTGLTEEIANEARRVSESLARAACRPEDDKLLLPSEIASSVRGSKIPTFFLKKTPPTKPSESATPPPCEEKPAPDGEDALSKRLFPAEETAELRSSSRLHMPEHPRWTGLPETPIPSPATVVMTATTMPQTPASQMPKKSISDCTLRTKNTSCDEENPDDGSKLQTLTSSTTRLGKVKNWIKESKTQSEKRRSVITVIGQTQGKSFSTVLNEINQRRKLAKELDKHALCEAILQTPEKEKDVGSNDKEIDNLIAKVDFVSPDGKILYSAKKIYGMRNTAALEAIKTGKCDVANANTPDVMKGLLSLRIFDEIPERDNPPVQTKKRKSKRAKKAEEKKLDVKGFFPSAAHFFLDCLQNQTVFSLAVLVCSLIFAVLFFVLKEKRLTSYLNIGKPKARSWYDELFRS